MNWDFWLGVGCTLAFVFVHALLRAASRPEPHPPRNIYKVNYPPESIVKSYRVIEEVGQEGTTIASVSLEMAEED